MLREYGVRGLAGRASNDNFMNMQDSARSNEQGASPRDVAGVDAFLEENPELQYVDCVFADLCGVVRGKRIARGALAEVFETGLAIPHTIYFLDARGEMVERATQAPFEGDGEGIAWPVAGTLTRVNWSQRPHGQVLMTLCDAKGLPYFGEPRNVLERVVGRFDSLELVPAVGCAFEFYLFDRERSKNGIPQPPDAGAGQGAVYSINDIDRFDGVLTGIAEAADIQGLPPLTTTSESGLGRFKIALASTDAVRAGDHAVFLRQIVRAVARKRGLDATFMAKPYLALPGSALEISVALEHSSGRDVFFDATHGTSEALRTAVAGVQALTSDAIALFAPNANAYRRFAAGGVARNKRWGINNKTTAISVGGATVEMRRIEHRLAGADANPYLALAAVLAGIHYGMSEGLDPGQPFEGNATTFVDQTMPFAIDPALVALENGSILREYLGPAYVDLYCATKRAELTRFRSHIPAHEYDWYL
jgi:glutamine synthetase